MSIRAPRMGPVNGYITLKIQVVWTKVSAKYEIAKMVVTCCTDRHFSNKTGKQCKLTNCVDPNFLVPQKFLWLTVPPTTSPRTDTPVCHCLLSDEVLHTRCRRRLTQMRRCTHNMPSSSSSSLLADTLRGLRPGCNPHRSLWRHWWHHNLETIKR